MKQPTEQSRLARVVLAGVAGVVVALTLGACAPMDGGGHSASSGGAGSGSKIEAYGVIDAGVTVTR